MFVDYTNIIKKPDLKIPSYFQGKGYQLELFTNIVKGPRQSGHTAAAMKLMIRTQPSMLINVNRQHHDVDYLMRNYGLSREEVEYVQENSFSYDWFYQTLLQGREGILPDDLALIVINDASFVHNGIDLRRLCQALENRFKRPIHLVLLG